jgi:hypothetical protein
MTAAKTMACALCTFLLIGAGSTAINVYGQAQLASSGIPDLAKTWFRVRCVPANSDVCPNIENDKALRARAKAFRDSFDEVAVPKYDCVQATPPSLLTDPYPFQIEQRADRLIFTYEKDDIVRTVWLDGRGHVKPKVNEFFTQGYSTGRYEGNQLVVETTKFSFDPTGLDDDFGNMPSSTQKKVVERYWREGDRLRADVTTEDPIFLLEPIKFSLDWQQSPQPPMLPWNCDPESAKQNLLLNPTKYPDPK